MRAWNKKHKPKFMAKPKWGASPLEAIYFQTYITLNSSLDTYYDNNYLNSFMVKKWFIGKKFGNNITKRF